MQILNCRVKEFGNLGLFHIKSKGHAKEEEMSEEELGGQRIWQPWLISYQAQMQCQGGRNVR